MLDSFDPIFEKDGKFYFHDPMYARVCGPWGPHDTREQAEAAYAELLKGDEEAYLSSRGELPEE